MTRKIAPSLDVQTAGDLLLRFRDNVLREAVAAGADLVPTAVEHERTYRELTAIALDPATGFPIKTTAGQPYYRVLEQERRRRQLPPALRRGLGQPQLDLGHLAERVLRLHALARRCWRW